MACSCGPRGSPCFDMSSTCMTPKRPGCTSSPMLPSSGHLAEGLSDYAGGFVSCWRWAMHTPWSMPPTGPAPAICSMEYVAGGTPAGPSVLQQRCAPVAGPFHAVVNTRQGPSPQIHLHMIAFLCAARLPGQPDLRTGPGKDADLCRRARIDGVSIKLPAQTKSRRQKERSGSKRL